MDSKRLLRLTVVIAVPLLGLLLAACSSPTPTPAPTNTPLPVADADGHQLYITKGCAACHGQDGEGTALAPTVVGITEEAVMIQVRTPRDQMPSFTIEQISDEELEELAHYISQLEGEDHVHDHETPQP